jgi:formylmethanofuran dehydrogenase subunit A
MDRSYRNDCLKAIHPVAQQATALASIAREYTLDEIAMMTRAAPARLLGLADRGRLSPGAVADITVYAEDADRERMFGQPHLVFKSGVEVARDGVLIAVPKGVTHVVRPDFDPAIGKRIKAFFDDHMSVGFEHFSLSPMELTDAGIELAAHPCRPRRRA